MRYKTWLKFPSRSIAVEVKNGNYECIEFNEKSQERKKLKICHSPLELKFYLLSLEGVPKEVLLYIKELGDGEQVQSKQVK